MPEVKYVAGKEGIQELWRRIKAEIGKFESFQKADPVSESDRRPDVPQADRKTNIIYLVYEPSATTPDMYKEWIWTVPEQGDPAWVCIGDTTTDLSKYVSVLQMSTPFSEAEKATARTNIGAFGAVYADVQGTTSGTTLTVNIEEGKYSRITVGSSITDLVIGVPADGPSTVGWFKFEFTLPSDTELERVSVLDSTGADCLMFAPMRWPGQVTYQGEVTNRIAKIIGYSPVVPEGPILCTETGTNIVTSDRKKIRYRIVED